ncbi:hypothetical protein GCM10010331_44520 [Streptomyces xanthochromogenes]|uniref:hypothetical protein n=1 Tax=Streptomyces xanthochromogenes TaxID=67384 RepID=UPI00167BB828|nr:hypothetical protein [Streptomyces xanthochromogenes]GHB52055.1 hypothetical protein GCM10010331_44520 [Streptomyces xanthochromogenes]
MDPNVALGNIREGFREYEADDDYDEAERIVAVEKIRESFEALDEWLRKGGFLPSDWVR